MTNIPHILGVFRVVPYPSLVQICNGFDDSFRVINTMLLKLFL